MPDLEPNARLAAEARILASGDPVDALLGLLVDIDERRVLTDEHDFSVYIDLPDDDQADVSTSVWAMERAGWVCQPADSLVWELTDRGREVVKRGTL